MLTLLKSLQGETSRILWIVETLPFLVHYFVSLSLDRVLHWKCAVESRVALLRRDVWLWDVAPVLY